MQLFNRLKIGKNAEYDSNMFSEKIESSEKNENLFSFEEDNVDKEMLSTLINLDDLNGSDIPRNMWGQRFELFLVKLFERAGYKVEKIYEPGKPDNGIDLIIEKDNHKIAIQAKNYKLDGVYSVDKTTVQNFVGAIEIRKDITSGALITTHFFTENAIEVCSSLSPENKKVELINREKLILLIAKVYPELLAKAFFEKEIQIFPRCPQCGVLPLRKNQENPERNIFMDVFTIRTVREASEEIKFSKTSFPHLKNQKRFCIIILVHILSILQFIREEKNYEYTGLCSKCSCIIIGTKND